MRYLLLAFVIVFLTSCNNPVYFTGEGDDLSDDAGKTLLIGDRRWKKAYESEDGTIRWRRSGRRRGVLAHRNRSRIGRRGRIVRRDTRNSRGRVGRRGRRGALVYRSNFATTPPVSFRSLGRYYSTLANRPNISHSVAHSHRRRLSDSAPLDSANNIVPYNASLLDTTGSVNNANMGSGDARPQQENMAQSRMTSRLQEVDTSRVLRDDINTFNPSVFNGGGSNGRAVDILFVVDTSESMHQFLLNAPAYFRGFIQALSPLDWRIFFTNSNWGLRNIWGNAVSIFKSAPHYDNGELIPLENNGRLLDQYVLSKSMLDYESIFIDTLSYHVKGTYKMHKYGNQHKDHDQKDRDHSDQYNQYDEYDWDGGYDWEDNDGYFDSSNMIDVPVSYLSPGVGSWHEQPLKTLIVALRKHKYKFRYHAHKVIVIISNSDEGGDFPDLPHVRTTADDVLQFVGELYPHQRERFTGYGIIMIPGDVACRTQYDNSHLVAEAKRDARYGVELARLAEITGGMNFSICDRSFVPLAQKILSDTRY